MNIQTINGYVGLIDGQADITVEQSPNYKGSKKYIKVYLNKEEAKNDYKDVVQGDLIVQEL